MRKLMLVLFVLTFAVAARAESVWLTLEGVGGAENGAYYVYPYDFAATGENSSTYVAPSSSSLISLICDDFGDEIYFGEYWQANVWSGASNVTIDGQMDQGASNQVQLYDDAAWLFLQLAQNPNGTTYDATTSSWVANSVVINEAIWSLFNSTANSDYGSDAAVEAAITAANGIGATANGTNTSFLSDVVFYTPVTGSQVPRSDLRPQEFIGLVSVPEPASVLLLGMGLLGMVAVARRKSAQKG